jgi:multiple sugar transport system substrate-binding protein
VNKKRGLVAAISAISMVFMAFTAPAHAATTVKMVLWPGPEGDAMQKVVNTYNAGQGVKDGVNVKMILLSRDNTFGKEATLMKARSNEYDIYFTASYLVGQHAPYMVPLTGINDQLYLKAAVNSLKVAGKQMALPLDTSLHFMYYRKDLLSSIDATKFSSIAQQVLGKSMQPNLNPDTWTWDDVLALAAYFTQQYNPSSPTKYGFALQGKNLLYNTMIWNDVLWSFGGNWLKNGKPNLNTPQAKAAMNVYYTIYTKGLTSPDSSNAEYPETNAALESGNAAFALQWNAAYTELNSTGSTKGVIGIAPPPGKGPRTHVHALAVGLNKFSKNQTAALKWMHYLATVPAMQIYANNGGVPSMPTILQGMVAKNPTFANVIKYGNTLGYSESAGPHEFDIYAALAQALSPMWAGEKTPDQVAPDANTAIANLLNS